VPKGKNMTEDIALWQALDKYFENATNDKQDNLNRVLPIIQYWPETEFIYSGIDWVVRRLVKYGQDSILAATHGIDEDLLNSDLFVNARNHIQHLGDLFSLINRDVALYLLNPIQFNTNDDVGAIAAYLLAKNFIQTIESDTRNVILASLKMEYETAIGTSRKMSIAWALFNLGFKQPWESFVYTGPLWQKEFPLIIEQSEKSLHPDLHPDELRFLVSNEIGLAEGVVINNTIPTQARKGLFEYLVMDIASQGKAFKKFPGWVRRLG
jgi:hypothetical protein